MRKAGCKEKVVVVRKMPQRRTQRQEEFEEKVLALDDFVKKI